MKKIFLITSFLLLTIFSCSKKQNIPVIGYMQIIEDETLDKARQGFIQALEDSGYSEKNNTVKIIYRNAQNDIATLGQIADYFISEEVDIIATNPTLSTITAVQKTNAQNTKNKIPVCMMVAPHPDIAGLTDKNGKAPDNLFGVYETLDYIDTSITLIKTFFPNAKRVGTIYNNAEPNSVNALNRLRAMCKKLNLELIEQSVTSSNETQQATASVLDKNIDVFFALPDNVIFSSFEIIYKLCTDKKIPIISSEAGLVARGALLAYGADFYQWGYQAGQSAIKYLRTPAVAGQAKNIPPPEIVKVRKKIVNEKTAEMLGIENITF